MADPNADIQYTIAPDVDVGAIESYLANVAELADKSGHKISTLIAKDLTVVAGAAVNNIMASVATHLGSLQGATGPIGTGLDMAGSTLDMLGSVAGMIPEIGIVLEPLLKSLAVVPGTLKAILIPLTQFSALAAPGTYQQFAFALEDVQAVIGHTFLPTLELMRDAVRLVGDTLASILPNASEMRSAMTEVRNALALATAEWNRALGVFGPRIRASVLEVTAQLSRAFAALVPIVLPLATSILQLASDLMKLAEASGLLRATLSYVVYLVNTLSTQLQILGRVWDWTILGMITRAAGAANAIPAGDPRSSVGAASRQASFQSIQGYQDELQRSAFSQSGSTMADLPNIANRQLSVLEEIKSVLNDGIPVTIANMAAAAASVPGAAPALAASFGTGAGGVNGAGVVNAAMNVGEAAGVGRVGSNISRALRLFGIGR